MSKQLTEALENIKRNEKEFAFPGENGHTFRSVRKLCDTPLGKAGIQNFCFRELRHASVSHLVKEGVNLTTVKELLGHKDIKMALWYSHLSPDYNKKAIEAIGSAIDTKMDTREGSPSSVVVLSSRNCLKAPVAQMDRARDS